MSRKYAAVTGANRPDGIGRALVSEFAARDINVAGTYRDHATARPLLDLAESSDRVFALQLDVTDDASCARFGAELAERFSRLDILINNAGMPSSPGTILTAPVSALRRQIATHAISVVGVTQAVLPLLRKSRASVVMNVTSTLGSIESVGAGWTHYAPAKTAANALTRQLAATLTREGICAFSVHPGWVATDIGGGSAPLSPSQSARHLCDLALSATMREAGTFKDYTGREVPW